MWKKCHKHVNDVVEIERWTRTPIPFQQDLASSSVPGYEVTIQRVLNGSSLPCEAHMHCIRLNITPKDGSIEKLAAIIRLDVADRMLRRFLVAKQLRDKERQTVDVLDKEREVLFCDLLAALQEGGFLKRLCDAVCRKCTINRTSMPGTVSSDLYLLWSLTSNINTELFSDAFNESGVLKFYCSEDNEDAIFGSIGTWEEKERSIEGGGGKPPFLTHFIDRMIDAFDMGARSMQPYCRCVLLPLGNSFTTMSRTTSLSAKGKLLVRIPPSSLPFQRQERFLKTITYFHKFEDLGLFIWVNREYLVRYPPPLDVEMLYFHWISRACRQPSHVRMNLNAFKEAFPNSLRSEMSSLDLFRLP